MSMELLIWIVIGGLVVCGISSGLLYYINETPSSKQLSRDFLIGAIFTGFLHPLIPDTFDEVKNLIGSTAGDLQKSIVNTNTDLSDPNVKVGPANF